jgi:hypothetical protein
MDNNRDQCPFGGLKIDPPVLNFTMVEGSPTPPAIQNFWIRTTGSGVVNPRWKSIVDVPWFHLTPTHGVSPTQVWVHVDSVGTAAGNYEGHATIYNADVPTDPPQVCTIKLSVAKPAPEPLAIITATIPDGVQGQPYSCQIQAEGGTPPYTWMCVGLPNGLLFDTGAISGTPQSSGAFPISVTVQDSDQNSLTVQYTLNIAAPPPPSPKVAITWPIGGETVYVGDTKDITWVTDRDTDDTIEISLSVNGAWIFLATAPLKDHSYPWLVDASQVCDDAYVKLQAPGNTAQSGPLTIKSAHVCPLLNSLRRLRDRWH